MKTLRFLVTFVVVAVVGVSMLGLSSVNAADKPIVLKYAGVLPESHPTSQAIEVWAQKLEDMSEGKLKVDLHHGGSMGTSTEVAEYLQQGVVALSNISTAFFSSFDTKFDIFSLPYLFRDEAHMQTVLSGEFGLMIKDLLTEKGIKGLAFIESGSRSVYTVDKPVSTPADLDGVKIRVMSKVAVATMNALGANGVPIPWGELYTSLQTGVVDAAENNPPSIIAGKHYEVCKVYSLTHHFRTPDFFVISEQSFQSLPENLQTLLLDSIEQVLIPEQKKMWDASVAAAMKELEQDHGMTIHVIDDLTPFIEKTADVRKEGAAAIGMAEWLDKIEKM